MSLFTISDLHLSLATPKPMDIFGHRWQGYTAKLEKNWRAIVGENDTVVIPGDISWAMHLDEAERDFRFLHSLPGKKILGKGNHDYWWTTVGKMKKALAEWGIDSIDFLHNNAYEAEDFIICGSRGWFIEERLQNIDSADHAKIAAREALRLKASLDAGKLLGKDSGKPILAFLHFPPVSADFVCTEIVSLLKEYNVSECFYGHLHGNYSVPRSFEYDGVKLTIIAADHLEFIPHITNHL